MVESLMEDQRVSFPKGEQRKFLLEVYVKSGRSWNTLAKDIGVSVRSVTDWKREKYTLPLKAVRMLIKISGLGMPTAGETRKPFWWSQKAAKIGGKRTYQKYGTIGDPIKRRRRWLEWWQTKGRFHPNHYFAFKKFVIPKKNEELAEFAGIMMGDGAITPRQVCVTVNHEVDREYSFFVVLLMKRLFCVSPAWSIQPRRGTITIRISRSKLVKFCQSIGLVVGNKVKQQIDIPKWIMNNVQFQMVCLRGLMDTDGCIFNECHSINSKRYCYPRLSLVSASVPLRKSAFRILHEMDFSPKMRNNRSVQLESRKDITRYFELIKSHNPKHVTRWIKFGGVG